jgi:thiol-disulfide isomerase/thioredoxin
MTAEKKEAPAPHEAFWTRTRLLATAVTLCLLALLAASSCNSTDETANVKPSTSTDSEAVPSLPASVLYAEMPSLTGNAIKLSDYSDKVVLVNLWATWCGPCRMETPELVKLHKEYGAKGLALVGLSTEDPKYSAEMVKDFVRHFDVDYPIGWATRDVKIGFMALSRRDAIPQSFIIARDGRVLDQFVGFSPQYTPEKLRQAIEAALSAPKAD